LALALVTLVLYLPVRRHGFVLYDDPDYITENRVVQSGLNAASVKWAFTTWHASNWHPVTWLSHELDCELFGLDAAAHHLINVLLHSANAVLLFALLLRLTATMWPSAFAAGLFAWHPLRVESVAWASERKDVLSGFFFLLALSAYVRYAQQKKLQPAVGATSLSSFYLLALLCFALGLMSKPMLVTLPFVLLLLDYWPLRRLASKDQKSDLKNLGPLLKEKLPFLALSAASCVITILAQRGEAIVSLEPYPFSTRLGNALVAYASYLAKTIWPTNLSVVYPLPHSLPTATVAAAAALLIGLSCLAWRTRHTRPHLLVGWLWYVGMLVPVIGLVQVGGQAMADRYTYLPLIGPCLAFAIEASSYLSSHPRMGGRDPTLGVAAAGLALAGCCVATEFQLTYWLDSRTLFAHAVEVTEDNAIALLNLGVALEQQGRREEALSRYRDAVRADPTLAQAHNNLANLLNTLNQTDQALAEYREALRLKPNAPLPHLNLATLLLKKGNYQEAAAQFAQAARLAPNDPRPHLLWGKALLREGRSAPAVAQLRQALELAPDDLQILTCLARVLAADQDPAVRDDTKAVALAERAKELSGGNQPFVLDTLAMAYARASRFEEARRTLQKALETAAAAGDQDALAQMHQRLLLYQAGVPYEERFANSFSPLDPRAEGH